MRRNDRRFPNRDDRLLFKNGGSFGFNDGRLILDD
jgi:hypothetical protein